VTAPILSFLLLLLYLFLFFFLHLFPCWNGDGFQEKGRRVSAAGDNSHLFFFLFLSRTNDDDQRGGDSSSTSFSCSKVVVNHKLATYEKPLVSSLLLLLLLLLFTSFLSSSPARSFALARLYLAMLFYPCRTYVEKPLYSSMCTISCSLSLAAADGWEETCPAAEKGEGETSKREE